MQIGKEEAKLSIHKPMYLFIYICCCSVMSNSLQPHGLWHTRLPCPSSSPRACSNSCPLSRWCHPIISSSVDPFSCLQFSPGSGSYNESALLIRWPKYWSFSFSISPSSEYSGLISFRIDCFDLFAIQGILKSLLQHQSSNTIFIYTENSKESTNNY